MYETRHIDRGHPFLRISSTTFSLAKYGLATLSTSLPWRCLAAARYCRVPQVSACCPWDCVFLDAGSLQVTLGFTLSSILMSDASDIKLVERVERLWTKSLALLSWFHRLLQSERTVKSCARGSKPQLFSCLRTVWRDLQKSCPTFRIFPVYVQSHGFELTYCLLSKTFELSQVLR